MAGWSKTYWWCYSMGTFSCLFSLVLVSLVLVSLVLVPCRACRVVLCRALVRSLDSGGMVWIATVNGILL